jgi:hypothetical protein
MSVRLASLLTGAFLALVGVPGNAQPGQPAPKDFAYGMQFDTVGVAAAFRSSIPLEVYRGVALPNLADMAVFNGRSELVPHAVEMPRSSLP